MRPAYRKTGIFLVIAFARCCQNGSKPMIFRGKLTPLASNGAIYAGIAVLHTFNDLSVKGEWVMKQNQAFTLIELLIVVAIIAILAAIAVPNFLEAQTRAKISRAKSDLRSLATGIESYATDFNAYAPCNNKAFPVARPVNPTLLTLERLSTPVAYVTTCLLPDPFKPRDRRNQIGPGNIQGTPDNGDNAELVNGQPIPHFIKYLSLRQNPTNTAGLAAITTNNVPQPAKSWVVFSAGPALTYPHCEKAFETTSQTPEVVSSQFYDPTNGTVSYGCVWRFGGSSIDPRSYAGEYFRQGLGK